MEQATSSVSRRGFLQGTAAVAGAVALSGSHVMGAEASPAAGGKKLASDVVPLGKTGLKISRVGIGTGSNNGHVQKALGKEEFIKVIRYAHEQGVTYIDSARNYVTFNWIADAIKDLDREKVFLQSKVWGIPGETADDTLKVIDGFRSAYNTDYIDSLLVHCMTKPGWTQDEQRKRMMDGFNEAKERKWIRSKGVSCHSLLALQEAQKSDFNEVHLVRINPQGLHMDIPTGDSGGKAADVQPVLDEIKAMHEKGRGIIGMKICGNGDFANQPEEREKSIRFALSNPNIDAIVIGMRSQKEIDENVATVNKVLATL
jgi:predicted aldo/keto reductase-like oxidoreductase